MNLFLRTAFAVAAVSAVSHAGQSGLTMELYGNSAMSGDPASTSVIDNLEIMLPFTPTIGSAEVTGTITLDEDSFYSFACEFSADQMVFVWVRDHLICHPQPIPFGNSPSSTDGSPENPLPGTKGETMPVVIHAYSLHTNSSTTVSVQWAHLKAPLPARSAPKTDVIPTAAFVPALPALEVQRRALQDGLKKGWSTWSYNMLGVVSLPDAGTITTAICQLSTSDCLLTTHIEDTAAAIRVGVFATDASYWQFYVGWSGINVSLSCSGGAGNLNMVAEPVSCAKANCSDYALVILPRFAWFRQGEVSIDTATAAAVLSPMGLAARTVRLTGTADAALPLPAAVAAAPHVAVPFAAPGAAGRIGLLETAGSAAPSLTAIQATIDAAAKKEYESYKKYGEYADVKEAVQAATMWNYVYTPAEYGPFLPVSRAWDFVKKGVNQDWAYVIFDWDNIFATFMTSLDSKDIAYSNFIQVIRSKTAKGMVPNFSAGGSKSLDRTEPPIGAKVMLEMYKKYNDTWLVELLYDDLVAWNSWFVEERMLGPLGLVSLGSDTIDGYNDFAPGTMQGARFESGLDNSPMYDGEFFEPNLKQDGSYKIGQMTLYDVGFASMFVSEAESLATLAGIIGRPEDATKMAARAASQRGLIAKHLWDEQGGIYTNKFWNGTFYRRISPTSFYAMMAGAPTDEQAAAMVTNWLLNPDHFCVAPNGDFKGNSNDCYWGLPSIQRADPAFPALGYWRGYVWGPMAQLTYWSLQQYDHVPAVRSGRKALCKQMTALMRSQWNEHRHICENYSPHKDASSPKSQGDCSGTKFYHWGALTGMISLIEDGYY